MGTDYCANAVYGVLPEGPIFDRFERLVAEEVERQSVMMDTDPDYIADDQPDVAAGVLGANPDLLLELKEQYGLLDCHPAELYWTGDEVYRPGRCDTGPVAWVFGFGLTRFPLGGPLPARFVEQAEWHTWVEAY
jgi:hypothetical protein